MAVDAEKHHAGALMVAAGVAVQTTSDRSVTPHGKSGSSDFRWG